MSVLAGRTGLITGVANRRSIAWSIAKALARDGARLALTYQGERLGENVRELAAELVRAVEAGGGICASAPSNGQCQKVSSFGAVNTCSRYVFQLQPNSLVR